MRKFTLFFLLALLFVFAILLADAAQATECPEDERSARGYCTTEQGHDAELEGMYEAREDEPTDKPITELPYTGDEHLALLISGTMLILVGWATVRTIKETS